MTDTRKPSTRKFCLKPLALVGGWRALPDEGMGGWSIYSEGGHQTFRPGLLDQSFGQRCDYGALFTYLFRRFGLPNAPSDPYKNIASYVLTTPLPDLALMVTPSVDDWPRLSFTFLVPEDIWRQLEVEPRDRWRRAMADWREQQGPLPDWMPDWLEFWRSESGVAELHISAQSGWRHTITDMHLAQVILDHDRAAGSMSEAVRSLLQEVAGFIHTLQDDYEAIQPHPDRVERSTDWRAWPEDDPLKRYYAAAAEALADLSRPVRVRDSAINAHGLVTDDALAAKPQSEPKVAGWAFGQLVNSAPDDAYALLRHARKLGRGSLAKGVRKLMPADLGSS